MQGLIAKQIMRQCGDILNFNPPFNSSSPRHLLPQLVPPSPGPGTYNIPTRDHQKTSKYHVQLQKNSKVKKEFSWIFGNSRSKSFFTTSNNQRTGPGAYEIQHKQQSPNPSWSKSSRFSQKIQTMQQPGPGSYEAQAFQHFSNNKKSFHQSVFKSKSPKISKTLFPKQQRLLKQNNNKLHSTLEQQVVQETPVKKESSSFFTSKVPRFVTEVEKSELGPGSYDILDGEKLKLRPEIPRLIRASQNLQSLQRHQKNSRMYSEVGPGSYNMNKYEITRLLEYKGLPLPRETRFNFKGKKRSVFLDVPGPGMYMQNRFQLINTSEILDNNRFKRNKTSPVHHSQHKESEGRVKEQRKEGPGFYNLNCYDINYNVQRKKQYQERLQHMEIKVPAFNSKVPRLK